MDQTLFAQDESDLFILGPEEEGIRIDKLLAERFPQYSRTYFQHLLETGCVLLNGEPIKKRTLPEEGDEIEICFQAIPQPSLEPENIPLEILYEDEHLLAINKPAGLVVHPAPGHWSGTFVNALIAHCQGAIPGADPLRPGIVHRLDKDTTGVLIAAKTLSAQQKLIDLFATRKMEKMYLAICSGRPPNGLIQVPIGRHPVHRKEMAVLPDGREALTEVRVLAFNEKASLVLASPRTGRTHQIRVHLKHVGCPVLHDPIYSRKKESFAQERLLLHAYRLSFEHPITKDTIRITAPLPDDMKQWIQKLCGSSFCPPNFPQ